MTKYEKAKNNSKKIKFAEILFVRILLLRQRQHIPI